MKKTIIIFSILALSLGLILSVVMYRNKLKLLNEKKIELSNIEKQKKNKVIKNEEPKEEKKVEDNKKYNLINLEKSNLTRALVEKAVKGLTLEYDYDSAEDQEKRISDYLGEKHLSTYWYGKEFPKQVKEPKHEDMILYLHMKDKRTIKSIILANDKEKIRGTDFKFSHWRVEMGEYKPFFILKELRYNGGY